MTETEELNKKFTLWGTLTIDKQRNGLTFITISNQFTDAKISLYGAQIISFKPKGKPDLLWMSPMSKFEAGKAIRGGIPVCFPWFGPHKTNSSKPQHGFGRLLNWEIVETATIANGETFVRLKLCSSEETKAYWPYDFIAEITFIIGKTLTVTLKVKNTTPIQFDYSCALHSYFNISSIEAIAVEGLFKARYHKHGETGNYIQESTKLKFQQMEDRHYFGTEATCIIEDPNFDRKISVAKTGSKITTVWNPGAENCARMSDMPYDAYKRFVCIEAVNSFDNTICLEPGEVHETSAIIGLKE